MKSRSTIWLSNVLAHLTQVYSFSAISSFLNGCKIPSHSFPLQRNREFISRSLSTITLIYAIRFKTPAQFTVSRGSQVAIKFVSCLSLSKTLLSVSVPFSALFEGLFPKCLPYISGLSYISDDPPHCDCFCHSSTIYLNCFSLLFLTASFLI